MEPYFVETKIVPEMYLLMWTGWYEPKILFYNIRYGMVLVFDMGFEPHVI